MSSPQAAEKHSSAVGNSNHKDDPTVNPTLTENDCEDLELLKGDAIGDTLYSERFVLNTLLKLGKICKDIQEDEEAERDLCSLWDMTIEKDVVIFLLEQDVLELFAGIIKSTEDKRLSEILVGILANMCNIQEAREQLEKQEETVQVLLELTLCRDSLTLEQLMRLLAVVFVKMQETSIILWYEHIFKSEEFTKNLCFILTSAANNTLVLQTMETLNAILAKFTLMEIPSEREANKLPPFEEVFVSNSIIGATAEAYKSLHKDSLAHMDSYETIPESLLKANQIFCNIHSILTQYGEVSRDSYKDCNEEMLSCLKEILKSISDDVSSWQQYEQYVVESLNDILRVLSSPFDLEIAQHLLKQHYNVSTCQERNLKNAQKTNDFEDDTDDEDIDYELLLSIILNTIYFLILKADKDMLSQCLSICPRKYSMKLMDSFQQPLKSESLKTCYLKLKDVLDAE